MQRQWKVWTLGRGEALECDQGQADPPPAEGVCIDCGDYLLKVRGGLMWLENSDGEGMPVAPEEFRALLDELFKDQF